MLKKISNYVQKFNFQKKNQKNLDNLNFCAKNCDFVFELTKVENSWILTIFLAFLKITIIHWFLARKFKFTVLLFFWDTILDFLTVWNLRECCCTFYTQMSRLMIIDYARAGNYGERTNIFFLLRFYSRTIYHGILGGLINHLAFPYFWLPFTSTFSLLFFHFQSNFFVCFVHIFTFLMFHNFKLFLS